MRLFTSESVTPGHPDKLCDQISDAILDAYLERDPSARVAVEVMATADGLVLAGEVGSSALGSSARKHIARATLQRVGYRHYAASTPILDRVVAQSPEIFSGVAQSLEAREAVAAYAQADPLDQIGAGDQGLMFGYACSETPDLMPLPITLAHALARRLYDVGGEDGFDALGPDGKTQVTVRYDSGGSVAGLESILVSTQHDERMSQRAIRRVVLAEVVDPTLEQYGFTRGDLGALLVNPSGSFVVGGPLADAGLTGRKIIVDTYGGAARHGGGAFSGKDPSKVDRSGAYAARWIAKHVVAAGLAPRCEVQIAYAIGSAHPVGLYATTYGSGVVSGERIADAIRQVFDLRPAAIIRDLDLRRPSYAPTAAFGHFGAGGFTQRLQRPWEQLSPSRIAALQLAVGGVDVGRSEGGGFVIRSS
jgi:S-adenosylmethionine synthetase